jgi:hypothetical protein
MLWRGHGVMLWRGRYQGRKQLRAGNQLRKPHHYRRRQWRGHCGHCVMLRRGHGVKLWRGLLVGAYFKRLDGRQGIYPRGVLLFVVYSQVHSQVRKKLSYALETGIDKTIGRVPAFGNIQGRTPDKIEYLQIRQIDLYGQPGPCRRIDIHHEPAS